MTSVARTFFTRFARILPRSLANNTAVPRNIVTPLFHRTLVQSSPNMSNPNLATLDVGRTNPCFCQLEYHK
jgi:hypothetical protein